MDVALSMSQKLLKITVELSRSVESLLQRNLRTIMEQSINRENAKDLTLNQILQFVTNLSYMEKSVRDVETNIRSHSTGTGSLRAPRTWSVSCAR